jgi:hypothetical protein
MKPTKPTKPMTCCGASGDRRLLRRASGAAGWLAPVVTLVLLPKCPLCLAAWFTLLTGVALPPAAASSLRVMLIAASLTALVILAVRRARRAALTLTRSRSPR